MNENREYPERPFVGVGVIVLRNEEVLLVQRAVNLQTKDIGASLEANNGLVKQFFKLHTGKSLRKQESKLINLL